MDSSSLFLKYNIGVQYWGPRAKFVHYPICASSYPPILESSIALSNLCTLVPSNIGVQYWGSNSKFCALQYWTSICALCDPPILDIFIEAGTGKEPKIW